MKGVIMSKDHLKLYHLALKMIEGDSKLKDFSFLIGPSKRQSIRKIKKIREMDFFGVVHGSRAQRRALPFLECDTMNTESLKFCSDNLAFSISGKLRF